MISVKETRYGRMMYHNNDKYIGRSLDLYGEAHFHEVEMLKQLVSPGDTVVDAGANIGTITVPLAQSVGFKGCVVAIEAQPYVFNILCGNLALNELRNVRSINCAVGDSSGQFAFMPELNYSRFDNFGGVSFSSQKDSKDDLGRALVNPISTIKIDDLKLSCPRLIKIDVEGMEPEVLLGAAETINKAKPFIYVEFVSNREKILEILKDFGYVWRLHTPPSFNENNFFETPTDFLLNDERKSIVSANLLCWDKSIPSIDIDSDFFV
jgi:FkbM family methyltransferase